ncbi:outer envelope pore protein 16-4, chloroplastic isoform X7 [Coffea arabica]|uniref:Outer envelope pore protein 16-4, chloroplastic isoform X7 n=1 Tax=Coffea arabica TaxID=13443 RepID=A0ABM4VUD4_COFAR|nr:outer envelope pore protein 16-4, chloroplastic-like isoform X6 [Coffea arabica]
MEGDIGGEVPCSSFAVDSALRVGTAGLIWGSCTGSLEATKLGLTGITRASFVAKSAGRYGIQWVLSFTRCGLQRYRGQHDWVNPVVAGAVAGTVIGASARNWKQAAGVSGLVCALYYAAEDAT